MKMIYGIIAGAITGFLATIFVTPRSGRKNRDSVNASAKKQWKNLQMAYATAANKLGLISAKKKAKINKKAVTAYNAKNKKTTADPLSRDNKMQEKAHEKSAATKAVDSPTAKSTLRKVPVNVK